MTIKLAIVIPAFKEEYLCEALDSVARQNCNDFRLYIGDDTGSGRLREIVEPYSARINLYYHGFSDNLGMENLAAQWERCIALTEGEDFIWLFSDDDIMPADAVKRFYRELVRGKTFDLYRFNLQQVNSTGEQVIAGTNHPVVESSGDFLRRRLKGETLSSACEYIFSRKIFEQERGFVRFPLAWCSDDATWYNFGREKGIRTIQGDPVVWRISQSNISSPGKCDRTKFRATVMYLLWIKVKNLAWSSPKLFLYGIKRQSLILKAGFFEFLLNLSLLYKLLGINGSARFLIFILRNKLRILFSYN